jgi:hypothetical protein
MSDLRSGSAGGGPDKLEEGSPPSSLIATVFPTQANTVFWVAIVVGFVFVVLPLVGRRLLSAESYQSNLLLCVGVALILGAVGSQATLKIGGLILAGSAASAVGLYAYLERERIDDFKRLNVSYVRGTLFNVAVRKYSARIKFSKNVLGTTIEDQYEFVVFYPEMDTSDVLIEITPKPHPDALIPIHVHANCFKAAVGSGRPLEWEYREAENLIRDRARDVVIGKLGDEKPDRNTCPAVTEAAAGQIRIDRWPGFISTAYAQGGSQQALGAIIADLRSDDNDTRRVARDQIALLPEDQLRNLLDIFRDQYQNYRIKLGICVGLAEMLRTSKEERGRVIREKLLNTDDRNLLLDAAGDKDRTVRIYASEFLFDLGDPEVTELAIKRASETSDETAQYQWLFLSQDGWRRLSAEKRAALGPLIKQIKARAGGKTRKLIDQLSS